MTLLIVERFGAGAVRLVSDSRLTFTQSLWTDAGVKILACPVRVWNVDERGVQAPLIYDATLGIGIVGQALLALTAVEAVRNVLVSLKRVQGYSEWSLASICRPIERVVSEVAKGFPAPNPVVASDAPVAGFVVTGLCPDVRAPRALIVELFWRDGAYVAETRQILRDKSKEFFGSGASEAELLANTESELDVFKILRRVIDGANEKVGGWIQSGELVGGWIDDRVDGGFEVHSVRHILDDGDGEIRTTDRWCGVEWYGDRSPLGWNDLMPRIKVKVPFRKELEAALDKAIDAEEE